MEILFRWFLRGIEVTARSAVLRFAILGHGFGNGLTHSNSNSNSNCELLFGVSSAPTFSSSETHFELRIRNFELRIVLNDLCSVPHADAPTFQAEESAPPRY